MSQIEKVKQSISNLESKKNKIFFFLPEVNGVPAGSIYEIYFHATTLKNAGYPVTVLTETAKSEKPEFIEPELTDLPHVSMDSGKLTVSPEDLLVIPEIFTNVMKQTETLPCMRTVLFQSVDNATKALVIGMDWSNFKIQNVITTGKNMEKFIEGFFGKGKFKIRTYNVPVPDYFTNKTKFKQPVISFLVRNERDLDKIVKLFLSKYPQYKWVNFEPLVTDSKPPKHLRRKDLADRLSKNFAALWIDRIASHAQFPLECMKAGTIPISLTPDITPEYLIGADGKSIENCGVWTDDYFQLPALIADTLRKFLDDEITDEVYEKLASVAAPYSSSVATEQLLTIYSSFFNERIDTMTKAIEVLEQQEALAAQTATPATEVRVEA
jgi:hypothetical protein